MRFQLWGLCLVVVLGLGASAGAQSTVNFDVTNSGATAYRFSGFGTTNNPTLSLVRGNTYNFNVNTPGHPFYLTTVANNHLAPAFLTGVTGSMVSAGTLTFVVPASAPDTLHYQCSVHDAMSGVLSITSPPPPGVPAGGWLAATILGAVVLLTGITVLRRRNAPAAG